MYDNFYVHAYNTHYLQYCLRTVIHTNIIICTYTHICEWICENCLYRHNYKHLKYIIETVLILYLEKNTAYLQFSIIL